MIDALIIGSGPNGLSAAIRLAEAGLSVLVIEGAKRPGGGTRSEEVTLPGFVHDICSAIHPLALASPYLKSLPLSDFGLDWAYSDAPFIHALTPDRPVVIQQDLESTLSGFGKDGKTYRRLMQPLVRRWADLMDDFLGPFPFPPKHPLLMARFGLSALQPAAGLAKRIFQTEEVRAAFGGLAAHSMMPLSWASTSGFGLMLGVLAHAVGWPMAKGGSQHIADAMVTYLQSMGGELQVGAWVESLADLPKARFILFDTSIPAVLGIAGDSLAPSYAAALNRYRYGTGVCKVDFALSESIPWKHPDYARAATVHLGGTLQEMEISEQAPWEGTLSEKPYVLLVQQSQFDHSRAPAGKHTAWAYCHVPLYSETDYSGCIENRIESFAPGFKDTILAKSVRTAVDYQNYNPNYVGGDINGGVQNLRQLYTRPAARWNPYRIPANVPGASLYLCSSATPPGGGVHGMCGYYAAEAVLKDAKIRK